MASAFCFLASGAASSLDISFLSFPGASLTGSFSSSSFSSSPQWSPLHLHPMPYSSPSWEQLLQELSCLWLATIPTASSSETSSSSASSSLFFLPFFAPLAAVAAPFLPGIATVLAGVTAAFLSG